MDVSKLKAGDKHYKAFVGPPNQYDFMGATQFRLLCTFGLRSTSKLLDFGCGSLRAGRLFIPYLDKGNYFGIEPNKWLIDDVKANDLGQDIFDLKAPTFDHNSEFKCDIFNKKFDFIVAQSIFSHTGVSLVKTALNNFKSVLEDDGLILLTFIHGKVDYTDDGWVYPACVEYTPDTINSFIEEAGLYGTTIPWFHPRQTWYVLSKKIEKLPNESMKYFLSGVVFYDDEFKESSMK